MSFHLLAIKILPSCAPGIRKCLEEGRLYSLSKAYAEDNDNPYLLVKVPSRLDRPALQELYNITREDNDDLNIRVSAIVGKNGDGKSTFLEVAMRVLNNFACYAGFKADQESLTMVEGLNAQVFYEVDDHILCIECDGLKVYWYQDGTEIEDIKHCVSDESKKSLLKKFHNEQVFYTMIINYSLYAYNSKILEGENKKRGCWIDGLFHKNDGYQTPIVINPMRVNGNIDVNREEYLSRQRLMSIFATSSTNEGRKISDNEEAVGFVFSLCQNSKLMSKTIREYFVNTRSVDRLWSDMKPYNTPKDKIHESLMDSFQGFWNGFHTDYQNFKTFFDVAFGANHDWDKTSRTDLGKYLNQFKLNVKEYPKNTGRYSFPDIKSFCGTGGSAKINFLQFYRLLIIISVWKSLCRRKELLFKDYNLNELVSQPATPVSACLLYALYKIISIMETYPGLCNAGYLKDPNYLILERPWPNDNLDGAIDADIETILSTHDYRTLKLNQTLNYLNREYDDLYGANPCDIQDIEDRYEYILTFDQMGAEFKDLQVKDVIPLLPAPVFEGDILLRRGDSYYTANQLSSGVTQRLNSVGSFIYHLRNLDDKQTGANHIDYSNVCVVFEEVELYFHPEYQKSYLNYLLAQISRAGLEHIKNLHIIFVTHSTFVLSDVLHENILCLKDGRPENDRPLLTFGANIHDLLRLPFFMSNGTIGDYAQSTINKVIVILKFHEFLKEGFKTADDFLTQYPDLAPHAAFLPRYDGHLDYNLFATKYDRQYIFDLISTIDEPIAHQSLMGLYDHVFATEIERIQRIAYLENELERLKRQR